MKPTLRLLLIIPFLACVTTAFSQENEKGKSDLVGFDIHTNILGYTALTIIGNSLNPSIPVYIPDLIILWSFDKKHHGIGLELNYVGITGIERLPGISAISQKFSITGFTLGPIYRLYVRGIDKSTFILGARAPISFLTFESDSIAIPALGILSLKETGFVLLSQFLAEIAYQFKFGMFTLGLGGFIGYRYVSISRTFTIGSQSFTLPFGTVISGQLSGFGYGGELTLGVVF